METKREDGNSVTQNNSVSCSELWAPVLNANSCLNVHIPASLPSPLKSCMINSPDSAVSSHQERCSMWGLDFITELTPGLTLFISLTV